MPFTASKPIPQEPEFIRSLSKIQTNKKRDEIQKYGMWEYCQRTTAPLPTNQFIKTLEEIRPHWWTSFKLTNPHVLKKEANTIYSLTKLKQTTKRKKSSNYWSLKCIKNLKSLKKEASLISTSYKIKQTNKEMQSEKNGKTNQKLKS